MIRPSWLYARKRGARVRELAAGILPCGTAAAQQHAEPGSSGGRGIHVRCAAFIDQRIRGYVERLGQLRCHKA